MKIGRNSPCPCGSGKKHKKCCLIKGNNLIFDSISSELKSKLDKPCWFHGTDQSFDSWKFPPPEKPGDEGLSVPHTSVFFTSDFSYAKGAGKNVATVSLKSDIKILDTNVNYEATEKLRIEVIKNPIASRTLNIEHDIWHNGWKTGEVMRVMHRDPTLADRFNEMSFQYSKKFGISLETASNLVQLNISRGLIELFCTSAKKLGFDALYGHEVDRHSEENEIIAQPWLAVFCENIVSEPYWN